MDYIHTQKKKKNSSFKFPRNEKSKNSVDDKATSDESILYVSSGTGYWGPPLRIFSFAEITKIKLRSASKTENNHIASSSSNLSHNPPATQPQQTNDKESPNKVHRQEKKRTLSTSNLCLSHV